jgi:plasmid maintenance system antidote protein VapI
MTKTMAEKNKVRQGDVAILLGISPTLFSSIKHGHRGISKAVAIKISEATGIGIESILRSKSAKEVLSTAGAIIKSKEQQP